MNINVQRATLADALATVAPTVDRRSTRPVLSHVLLVANSDGLTLETTDTDASTRHRIKADVTESGALCVPHRLLTEIARSASATQLTLSPARSGNRLTVTAPGYSATLHTLPAEDFPDEPDDSDAVELNVDGAEFAAVIDTVQHAVGTDISRRALEGVSMVVQSGLLTLAATDGYRLAVAKCDVSGADVTALVRPGVLRAVASSGAGAIAIRLTDRRAVFDVGTTVYAAQLIDATYPAYAAIVPKTHDTTVTVNRSELAQAVKAALLFARTSANIVTFATEGDVLTLQAAGEDGETCLEVDAQVQGAKLDPYRLNAAYVLDMLGALEGETVTARFTEPTRPGLWTGSRDGAFCVAMPMSPR
jgi:DNA polymerase-3 subunit beta